MIRIPAPAAFAISAVAHGAALLALARVDTVHLSRGDDVAIELVESAPSPPPREPPAPPPRLPPRAVPVARVPEPPAPLPGPPPTAPRDPAPPPPTAAPPDATPPAPTAPLHAGVSPAASSTEGGLATPVGNTLYGQAPRTAPDPADVKPYAGRYVPPAEVTALPRLVGACAPSESDYPEEARQLGFEGVVMLAVTVDERGRVADVRIVRDPGHGLGPAAAAAYRRSCRFEPARRGGEPVATSIRVPFRFTLP